MNMKKLILSLTVVSVFIFSNAINAQKISNKTKSTTTKTIQTDDETIKLVEYKGVTYYIFNSTWHTKMKNRYVLRNAPKGAKIDFKPEGGEFIIMGGKKYYKCKGIFYKQNKDSIYEVVRI